MSLSIEAALSGGPSASSGGVRLHSSRDPRAEARRFLEAALDGDPGTILLLGPCLAYLVEAARSAYPGALIAAAQYDADFRGREAAVADIAWYPDLGVGLEAFLIDRLGPEDVEGLRIVEWPPAAKAWPEASAAAADAVKNAVLSLNGAANALAAFGRAFLYNPARNLANGRERLALARRGSAAAVIAASGPSLEALLPLIAETRPRIWLAALSSALPALALAGIEPDIVFTVDSGFWAMSHLRPEWTRSIPVAAGPSARLPADLLATARLLFLDSGTPYDRALLARALADALPARTSATVAASALEATLRMTTGAVILAGMDLSSLDLRSHARPNAFDALNASRSGRLRPLSSIAMEREAGSRRVPGGRRVSSQLETYAALLSRSSSEEDRVYRCAPGAPPIRGVRDIDPEGLASLAERCGDVLPALGPAGAAHEDAAAGAARAIDLVDRAHAAFMADGALGAVERDVCSCICLSSLLKRRKALRSGNAELLSAARAELSERREKLRKRLSALGGTL